MKKLKDGGEKLVQKRKEIAIALQKAIEKEKWISKTTPDLPDINSIGIFFRKSSDFQQDFTSHI